MTKKRLFDILFSLMIIAVFAPLCVGIALLIAIASPGKVIYVQKRLGRRGKVFRCYKFRTMAPDAENKLPELLEKYPALRLEWEKNQKLRRDPRVFRLGRFLRKTSLDELPQFWNVLKGDLSVVGPRPYTIAQGREVKRVSYKILSVKPGITGLWQTSGRSGTTFGKRLHLDAEYVEKKSLWLDLKLIAKTIPLIIFPKNAY